MKKIFAVLLLVLMIFVIALPALAETFEVPLPGEAPAVAPSEDQEVVTAEPEPEPVTGPWTWAYLATIAGATAATLLITQFLKVPLDKVWKIPTRLVVYILALVIMLLATNFTTGITASNFPLCILNAFIVALAAYGSYEMTFAKIDRA